MSQWYLAVPVLLVKLDMHFRAEERTQATLTCDIEMNGKHYVTECELVLIAAIALIAD